MAELIKEARSFGDLSENSEYDEAKNEQGKLYSRMAELDEILSNYVVIEEEEDGGAPQLDPDQDLDLDAGEGGAPETDEDSEKGGEA